MSKWKDDFIQKYKTISRIKQLNKEFREKMLGPNNSAKANWYEIRDMVYPNRKILDRKQMISYARKCLSSNKMVYGVDKEIKSKDLESPINAWAYLKNIGVGVKTNRKIF